jgi:glycosyltransferase involved in cell wall biosynthesis
MRILTVGNLYPPRHFGGYERVWQAAVGGLRRAGHDVRVLVSDAPGEGEDTDPDIHRDLPWYWRDFEFPRQTLRERRRTERGALRALDRHLAEFRPDVVSWWSMGGLPTALVTRPRVPAIGWVNDVWFVYAPLVDQWRRLPFVRAVDVGPRARWVFCSAALEAAMQREVPGLVDTGVEHQGAGPEFAAAPARPWGWRLLYVGRIDERKGIATAIEALPLLPEATLRIVGEGDAEELVRLRSLAGTLGVAERVTFDGPRSDLPAVYAETDVTVFPVVWFEPYGLVPLESMAVGRPVVATGRGGSADYLRDGENALLFEAEDATALAAAVQRLAGDEALRERLVQGGRELTSRLTEARWLEAVVREHERLLA